MARALNALNTKTEMLNSMACDYGAWDDTFYFVLGEHAGYVNDTLYPAVLANLDTNIIL